MKRKIAIAVMLAVLIAELLWLCFDKQNEYNEKLAQHKQQTAAIAQRTEEVQQKQQELDAVAGDVQKEQDAQLAQLDAEAKELENQAVQVQSEAQQLEEAFDTERLELAGQDEEYSYYVEVYNVLKEGLEKVKGYIAGN